jgi:hypothetical protein
MDEFQLLELKGFIEKRLIFEIIEQAAHIDTSKYPCVRFALEFNFDEKGLITDAGVEPRYRRSLKA